jgi:hypothetical protein
MTSSGIEPTTFRLVAQCLNHIRYGLPLINNNVLHYVIYRIRCSIQNVI